MNCIISDSEYSEPCILFVLLIFKSDLLRFRKANENKTHIFFMKYKEYIAKYSEKLCVECSLRNPKIYMLNLNIKFFKKNPHVFSL
jgi:hypothetical protein